MGLKDIAAALHRAESVFSRRPSAAFQRDAPATATWRGGTRIVATHDNGASVPTDMPTEFGGTGDQVSPGWLFRAGLAGCAATCIAMSAATQGIELRSLRVSAHSSGDARGVLGMKEPDGTPVYAGVQDLQLRVEISAPQVAKERLLALVEYGLRVSPIYASLHGTVPIDVQIEVGSH
jgi:uncharacterized OsmC-like protein